MTQRPARPSSNASPSYVVDPARCADFGRSIEDMLLARRCPKCQEEAVNGASLREVDVQVQGIVECCSKQDGYIQSEMPLQEIAFRVILSRGNNPVGLAELHDVVAERWATPTSPKNISPEGMRRILNRDRYYCFREVSAGG